MGERGRISAERTALLVFEPQHVYLGPEGERYAFVKASLGHQEELDSLERLLERARSTGITVVFVPFHLLSRDFPELQRSGSTYPPARPAPEQGRLDRLSERHRVGYRDEGAVCLECGKHWPCDTAVAMSEVSRLRSETKSGATPEQVGSEAGPRARPGPRDLVVEGSRTLDAFLSTELDRLLRAHHIEYLAFAGFHTNWCLESSARSAYDRGYRVILVSDCSAADSKEEQRLSEQLVFARIGEVMTSDQLLGAVEPELALPQAFLG